MLPCSIISDVVEIKFSLNPEPMLSGILPILMGTTPGQYGKKMGTRGGEVMLQFSNSAMLQFSNDSILQ